MLTPVEFEQKYRQVHVPYLNKNGLVNHLYVNVNIYSRTGRNAQFPEKDKILDRLRRDLKGKGGSGLGVKASHRGMIARAFYGKGSPDDCAMALTYALAYGRTQPYRLQQYCDSVAKIGIDCSGFVNNYFRTINRISEDRIIPKYSKGPARDNITEMQATDVLIWTDNQGNVLINPRAHIAILNTRPDGQGRAVVVESASSLNGLTRSTYTFTEVEPALFRVQRPSGKSHVKVVAVR
jgi:hypothetical protein